MSDRPDGYGGTDIYVALRNKRGEWTDVLNLGPVINTPRDEDDVFVSENGQHLYFSSNGHAGMGDLDIYRSAFDSTTMKWSEPLNLGYPINSVENDIYFVMTGDEKYAYISSFRADSKGEQDIYRADLTNWKPISRDAMEEKATVSIHQETTQVVSSGSPALIKSADFVKWGIQLLDATSKSPVPGKVWAIGSDKKEIILKATGMGTYKNVVERGANFHYQLMAEADGYESYYGEFQLAGAGDTSALEQTIFMKKKPITGLSSINLFYETEQITPQNQSHP